jgi:hypothetical protein
LYPERRLDQRPANVKEHGLQVANVDEAIAVVVVRVAD